MKTNFFKNNRQAFIEKLDHENAQKNYAAILFSGQAPYFSGDGEYPYIPNKNFYYLTGLERENFKLLIVKRKQKVSVVLFIERPNHDVEKWTGIKMRADEAKEISGIDTVMYNDEFETYISRVFLSGEINQVWLDIERQNWDMPQSYPMYFADKLKARYAHVQVGTLHTVISELRVLKQAEEIHAIKVANDHTKRGFEAILSGIKPGLPEYAMSALFEYEVRLAGAKGLGFLTIAASGENAVILHYVENNKIMKDGDLLLLDFGALEKNYSADISRTIPVNGKYTKRQKEIYNAVLRAQEAVIEAIKPGVPYAKLNEIARASLIKDCKALAIIQDDKEIGDYYYHGVSHFLGLDTHDVGDRDTLLKPGMVVTVEPGLYVAQEGIGIRIEDDILVTDNGYENLSAGIPKTVEEIENFMAGVQ